MSGPKRDPVTGKFEARTYEVTVWDTINGDIVRKEWSATECELREIEDSYRDEPGIEIQYEERP